MKKSACRILTIALILVLALSLTACGGSAKSAASYDYEPAEEEMAYESYDMTAEAPAAMYGAAYGGSGGTGGMGGVGNGAVRSGSVEKSAAGETAPQSKKIIYTAYAELESTNYETAVQAVYDLVEEMGGYMESTSVSGSNYASMARGYANLRNASFTIRIPCEQFEEFTGTLSTIGNVPYCNTNSENITMQYYDTQSRLTAYETQEKRLLEMLAIAETVEDMLAIQQQLTEVQYQLDSIKSTLRYYDNQIGYSTVNLSVNEVQEYTPEPVVRLSYWERMGKGFKDSLKSVGEFFTGLFLWIISNLPVLIVVVAALYGLFCLVRFALRTRNSRRTRWMEKRQQRREKLFERKAKRASKKAASRKENKDAEAAHAENSANAENDTASEG